MPDATSAVAGGFGFMGIIFSLIGLLLTIFWIVEIVDVLRRDFDQPNNKILWALVVILLNWVGAAIYYFVGKPQGTLRT